MFFFWVLGMFLEFWEKLKEIVVLFFRWGKFVIFSVYLNFKFSLINKDSFLGGEGKEG